MRAAFERSGPWMLLSLVPALLAVGEVRYARSIRPDGVTTVAGHVARFGTPRSVREVGRVGETFYEIQGFPGGQAPPLAFPSGPPAYVYDRGGRLVDWCPDPGDQPSHRLRWPGKPGPPLDDVAFRQLFSR